MISFLLLCTQLYSLLFLILLAIWEFCTVYFDYIYPLSHSFPTHPTLCTLFLPPYLGVTLHVHFPSPCWKFVCLELAYALGMLLSPLKGHSAPVILCSEDIVVFYLQIHYSLIVYYLQIFTFSTPYSEMIMESLEEEVWYICPI